MYVTSFKGSSNDFDSLLLRRCVNFDKIRIKTMKMFCIENTNNEIITWINNVSSAWFYLTDLSLKILLDRCHTSVARDDVKKQD